jgi:hypothetical protein
LAQLQAEPDKDRLNQFAAELDRQAEALERSAVSVCLPPVAAPSQHIQQQVQQQQSVDSSPPCTDPKETS